jgi:hypothetical protein
LVGNKVLPQFIGNEDYDSIYNVHSYPSVKDPRVHVSSKQCSDVFKSFFLDKDAVCTKLVHHPRFQAIQEMDRSGIHELEWIRMSGHIGRDAKVHTRSYARNPPSKCLVPRGGGDSHNIRSFHPNHFSLLPVSSFGLMKLCRSWFQVLYSSTDKPARSRLQLSTQ